jgi:hypothetical protein
MDVKLAHTTSRIVDPKSVEARKQYRNIGEVEADRSQISYSMTEQDAEYYEKMKRIESEKERQRQLNLQKSDMQSMEQFEKLHKLLLGR